MTTPDRFEALLEPGEAMRFQAPLRRKGRVGLTDGRLLVVTDGSVTAIPLSGVREVTIQDLDWYLVLLSVVVVGFGVLSLDRSVPGGLAFLGFGVASLYWTYRKRGKVQVRVDDRRNPVTLYPDETEPFREALERALERAEERLGGAAGTTSP